jgi:hypothetical protein
MRNNAAAIGKNRVLTHIPDSFFPKAYRSQLIFQCGSKVKSFICIHLVKTGPKQKRMVSMPVTWTFHDLLTDSGFRQFQYLSQAVSRAQLSLQLRIVLRNRGGGSRMTGLVALCGRVGFVLCRRAAVYLSRGCMKRVLLVVSISVLIAVAAVMTPRGGAQVDIAGPSPTPTPAADSYVTVKEFLLTSAAEDFHEHQPPYPAKFRRVKIGHVGDTTKSGSWRMCGEFLPAEDGDKAKWTGFATVKTSGYEQYIGSGSTYCTNTKIVWNSADLSAELKARLESIKKAGK